MRPGAWIQSSWRVSRVIVCPFPCCHLIAKKDSGPRPAQRRYAKPSSKLMVEKEPICKFKNHGSRPKGGKKGGKGKVRVPNHIFKLGGTASNPAGEAICFGFNSNSGCSEAADGAKCQTWVAHVCAKCYGLHGIQKHESDL